MINHDLLPSKCMHPVRIVDPRKPNSYLYVPCGHCRNCLSNRRHMWMRRLFDEASTSSYVMFFTLTYDNRHIPKAYVSSDSDVVHTNYNDTIDYKFTKFNCHDFHVIEHYPRTDCFAYCRKADLQLFFKRLRRRLETDSNHLILDVSPFSRSFRYFVCSEYGPKTYRPHYHGLLFFNSREVGLAAQNYLPSCWKLCSKHRIDCSEVVSNAPQYVAKYVCCSSQLPSSVAIKAFAPFYLFSRRPSLGSHYHCDEDIISRVYDHHTQDFKTVVSGDGVDSQRISTPRSSFSRFFTKPFEFYKLDCSSIYAFARRAVEYTRQDLMRVTPTKVMSKYGYGSYNVFNHKVTWSLLYHDLSDIDADLGIPQNRRFVRNVQYCVNVLHMPISEYVFLFLRFWSLLQSDALLFQYQTYNFLISKGYSVFECISFCYPDFKDTLPVNLYDTNVCIANVELMLNSFDLTICDVYDDNMIYNHCFDFDFRNTSLFQHFCDDVYKDDLNFDKVRLHNFYSSFAL